MMTPDGKNNENTSQEEGNMGYQTLDSQDTDQPANAVVQEIDAS